MRTQMAQLIAQMIDGRIQLDEAVEEFEKIYIQQALKINGNNLSKTATALGIHRNTLSKRVTSYNGRPKVLKPTIQNNKNGKRPSSPAKASAKRPGPGRKK